MSIMKEKIKFNNQDIELKINLGVNNNLTGYQQEIDLFTEEAKIDLINPVIDYEVRKFSFSSNIIDTIYLQFYFYSEASVKIKLLGLNYFNLFSVDGANFTDNEMNSKDLNVCNSFFIMDIYDTYDNNTQTKISTNYLTKIYGGENQLKPEYKINKDTVNQFYNLYIPKSFLDEQTGTTVTGYVKFSFYNAKYGNLTLFYNKDITNQYSSEKMYFKIILNLNTMTWEFDYNSDNYPPNVVAYQLLPSNKYSEKVNNGIQNFDNLKQIYPTGNTFQDTTATYVTS